MSRKHTLTAYGRETDKEKLEILASKYHISRSDVIIKLIRKAFDEHQRSQDS